MAEIKNITLNEFELIAAQTGYGKEILSKDYMLTNVLFLLKDVEGACFKGGTALQKIFLNHSRLSEDIDFTVTKNLIEIEKEITNILKNQESVTKIGKDKNVAQFVRMVIHYKNLLGTEDSIFIDLNERAKLFTKPESHVLNHFYKGFIPEFSVTTLSEEEMVAEKIAAAIGRNKPRDHYDIYQIIKHKMSINMKLIEQKCKQSGD